MAKSREKVQQLGFWDTEVSKPDHDAICLWAYKNAEMIVRTVSPDSFDHPWLEDEVHFDQDHRDQAAYDLAKAFTNANPRPNPRICRKTLEGVLKSYTGHNDKIERIVGYADLLIETECPRVVPTYNNSGAGYTRDEFDGFEISWASRRSVPLVLVEAKTVIPSVGELLRQINLYRTAFGGKPVVVSPDDTFAEILAEQGVTFIKYAP